jgi:hypothetical protein
LQTVDRCGHESICRGQGATAKDAASAAKPEDLIRAVCAND